MDIFIFVFHLNYTMYIKIYYHNIFNYDSINIFSNDGGM